MKRTLAYVSLFLLAACVVKHTNKKEVQFTGQPKLEELFECKCVKAYKDGNQLYLEIKNSPLVIRYYKTDPKNYDFLHHAGIASFVVANFLRGTELDTFHIQFTFDVVLAKATQSFSYATAKSIDIADKIELASLFCRSASDSDFATAKQILNPALIDTFSEEKINALLREFQSFGKVTDVTLKEFRHDEKTNYLAAIYLVTFDSNKHATFWFQFPLVGPKYINGYELMHNN